jgi:hypothetical protein
LHKKYGPERIACVSLNLDYEGSVKNPPESFQSKVLKTLREKGATFDNIIASEESDVMYKHLGITNPPAVFVYDITGQKRETFTTAFNDDPQAPGIYDRAEALVAEWVK